jgi:hypothetical protein
VPVAGRDPVGTPGRMPGASSAAITKMACATRLARIGATRVSGFATLSTDPSDTDA